MIEPFLKNLWRWKISAEEHLINPYKADSLDKIRHTNWSKKFIMYMMNRMVMGYFRYGPLRRQAKGQYDNIGSIIQRVELYNKTGNDEILIDIANLAMVEFVNGIHSKKHFKGSDDGTHTKEKF